MELRVQIKIEHLGVWCRKPGVREPEITKEQRGSKKLKHLLANKTIRLMSQ